MNCTICLDEATHPSTLGCNHTFCFHCILKWVVNHSINKFKCPCCREDIFKFHIDDKVFEYEDFQLLFNAVSYFFVDHDTFPPKSIVIGEILSNIVECNNFFYDQMSIMMLMMSGCYELDVTGHVMLLEKLLRFIDK